MWGGRTVGDRIRASWGGLPSLGFTRVILSVVLLVAVLDWIGWAAGIEILTKWMSDWVPMRPWTALWLAALAVAILLQIPPRPSMRALLCARMLCAVVGLFAALTLAEYLRDVNLGFDQWLFGDAVRQSPLRYPGRPSEQTAAPTLLLAGAVALLRIERKWAEALRVLLLAFGAFIPVVSAAGYLFTTGLVHFSPSVGIAPLTVTCLLLLVMATITARPDRHPLAWFASGTDHASLMRMGFVILGFPLIAWGSRQVLLSLGGDERTALEFSDLFSAVVIGLGVYVASRQQQALLHGISASEAHFRLLAESAADVILETRGGIIRWVSPALTSCLGWHPDAWVGHPLRAFTHAGDAVIVDALDRRIEPGRTEVANLRMRAQDGSHHWIEIHAAPAIGSDGSSEGIVASFRVIDQEMEAQRRLEHRATYDGLTGVLMRDAVFERLHVMGQQSRAAGVETAVLFVDIDLFKTVNDTMGHSAGDVVLRAVTERIRSVLRNGDSVARMGGDEFLVVLEGLHDLAEAVVIAEKIRNTCLTPVATPEGEVAVSLSIGVTLSGNAESSDAIVARADAAMYLAKNAGRNRVVTAPRP